MNGQARRETENFSSEADSIGVLDALDSGESVMETLLASLERMGMVVDGAGKPLAPEKMEAFVRHVLDIGARCEREKMRRRRAEGVATALERGVQFGRPPKPLPKKFYRAVELWENGTLNLTEAARMCGMARTTFRYQAQNERGKNG